jgi:hypothetical protein
MKLDSEWEVLGREWRQVSQPLPDLRARVRKESRRLRLFLAGDILVTVLFGGGSLAWAVVSRQTDVAQLAVAVWTCIGAAWLFGMVNRAGTWSPSASTTTAFLDVSIRRCRATAAMAVFGMALWLAEVVFFSAWVYRYLARRSLVTVEAFLLSWPMIVWEAATVVFLILSMRYRRRQQAELASLLDLKHHLDDAAGPEL